MKMRWLVVFLTTISSVSFATVIGKRIYINRGNFTTVDNQQFPYLAFNETNAFNARNANIDMLTADSLSLKVINNDSLVHRIAIGTQQSADILPGDSTVFGFKAATSGVFVFYDPINSPDGPYMGLAGMLCVTDKTVPKKFYWNIHEHQIAFNISIASGAGANWKNYEPDYFTINGLSHPDLQNDSTAVVTGNVGDTIFIFIANTGISLHSIHFHGFHCSIKASNNIIQIGREKDTFPLRSMDAIILEMIPDKTGRYSVHDHNLVAVSGGGKHPNGMFLIMEIK